MGTGLYEQLELTWMSFKFFIPEVLLTAGILLLLASGLVKKEAATLFTFLSSFTFLASLVAIIYSSGADSTPADLFNGMLRHDSFSTYLKILIDVAGIFTVLMTWRNPKQLHLSEYYALVITVVLGAHLLVMSNNFVTVFI